MFDLPGALASNAKWPGDTADDQAFIDAIGALAAFDHGGNSRFLRYLTYQETELRLECRARGYEPRMGFYIRRYSTLDRAQTEVWKIDNDTAVRVGIGNPEGGVGTFFEANPAKRSGMRSAA